MMMMMPEMVVPMLRPIESTPPPIAATLFGLVRNFCSSARRSGIWSPNCTTSHAKRSECWKAVIIPGTSRMNWAICEITVGTISQTTAMSTRANTK